VQNAPSVETKKLWAYKKMFESKLEGSRRRGRPSLRWMENVEKNLR